MKHQKSENELLRNSLIEKNYSQLLNSLIELDYPHPVDARAEAYEKVRQQLLANLEPKLKDRYLADEAEWFSWFDPGLINLGISHLRSPKPKETKLLLHVLDLIILRGEHDLMPEACEYIPPALYITNSDAEILLSDGPDKPGVPIFYKEPTSGAGL